MNSRDIIADLASVGVTIKDEIQDKGGSGLSRVFTITSKIHKGSPFTHPTTYSEDYPQQLAFKEVGEYWATRLGYGYKTVFGVI